MEKHESVCELVSVQTQTDVEQVARKLGVPPTSLGAPDFSNTNRWWAHLLAWQRVASTHKHAPSASMCVFSEAGHYASTEEAILARCKTHGVVAYSLKLETLMQLLERPMIELAMRHRHLPFYLPALDLPEPEQTECRCPEWNESWYDRLRNIDWFCDDAKQIRSEVAAPSTSVRKLCHDARLRMKRHDLSGAWQLLELAFGCEEQQQDVDCLQFHRWHEAAICRFLLHEKGCGDLVRRITHVPPRERERFLSNLIGMNLAHPSCFELEKKKPKLVIWCGETNWAGEPWDFESPKEEGIGGSEEAVIYMAQELARYYWVTVYAFPHPHKKQRGAQELPWQNPRLLPSSMYARYHERVDVILSWRQLTGMDVLARDCTSLYLWLHDLPFTWLARPQSQIMAELACVVPKLRSVMFLSEWHRRVFVPVYGTRIPAATSLFPKLLLEKESEVSEWTALSRQKCFVTRNGIQPQQFTPTPLRKRYRCIYASNYSRGLEVLLDCWPQIRQRFPSASLDIYYGWPACDTPIESILSALEALRDHGVKEHGRIDQERLAHEFLSSEFWTYPCTFDETFCITALKAQAAGCVPVVIRRAALTETVTTGYACTTTKEYPALLLRAMTEAFCAETPVQLAKRQEEVLHTYSWRTIAADWHRHFSTC